jgi:long-chain fatty acid transport protein
MILFILLLSSVPLFPGDYLYNTSISAKSYGMGGLAPLGEAVVIDSNPALLEGVKNRTIQFGNLHGQITMKLKNSFIGDSDTPPYQNRKSVVASYNMPYFGYAQRINEKLVAGLALYVAGGGGGGYSEIAQIPGGSIDAAVGLPIPVVGSSRLAYKHTSAVLYKVNLTPGISFRITNKLFFGLGTELSYASLQNEIFYSLTASDSYRLPGVGFNLKGDPAYSAGGKIGFLWKLTEFIKLGYGYTTSTVSHIDGGMSIGVPRPEYYRKTGLSQEIKFPEFHSLRLSYDSDKFTLGGEIKYFGWKAAQRTSKITLEDPWLSTPVGQSAVIVQNTGLKNLLVALIGIEYIPHSIAYRAGVRYGNNPVASAGVVPFAANIQAHINLGIGIPMGDWMLDIGFEHGFKNNQQGTGEAFVNTLRNIDDLLALRMLRYSNSQSIATNAVIFGLKKNF